MITFTIPGELKDINQIGAYQIELNGKRYVGSTTRSFKSRWGLHLNHLRKGIHINTYLQNAFNKYGEDSLNFSILEYVKTPEEVIVVEQKYIDQIKPEYNIFRIAGSALGYKVSEETKIKISNANRGKKPCLGKQNNLGYKHTEEAKKRIGEASKGNKYGSKNKGKEFSEERRKNISKARIGWIMSEEQKQKLSDISKKYAESEEGKKHLQKLCEIHRVRIVSSETKEKMSKVHKGIRCANGQILFFCN